MKSDKKLFIILFCRPQEEVEAEWRRTKKDKLREFKKRRKDVSVFYFVKYFFPL
jgi:hypothetical protein